MLSGILLKFPVERELQKMPSIYLNYKSKFKGDVILEVVVNGKDEYDFRGNILTSPMRQ